MNIFYVNRNPHIAAKELVDKHVVKMILETAQLLCGAHHVTHQVPTKYRTSTVQVIPQKSSMFYLVS